MLDVTFICGEAVLPYVSTSVAAHVADEPWQISAYYRLRRAVFAEEQGLFSRSDVDEHDLHATPIVAVGHVAGMADEVIGAVRIYAVGRGVEGRVWFGGRLGVSPLYRSRRVVGSSLIRAAVSTAHAWGCRRFLATIQVRNVGYFEQHHFATVEPVEVCGQPHHLMEADLGAYPPRAALSAQPVRGDTMVAAVKRVSSERSAA
jgi:putative N-acetyltransferase (TIGR04045 family)